MATSWTKINKASGTSWAGVTKVQTSSIFAVVGQPIGLLLALTYGANIVTPIDPWTQVTKPTGTPWTTISKAT